MEVPTAQRLAQGRGANAGGLPPRSISCCTSRAAQGMAAVPAMQISPGVSGRRHSGWLRLGPESMGCDPAATSTSPETQLPLDLWEKLGWGSGERGG